MYFAPSLHSIMLVSTVMNNRFLFSTSFSILKYVFTTKTTKYSPKYYRRKFTSSSVCSKDDAKSASGIDEIRQSRVDKLGLIKADGINPFAYSFEVTHSNAELQEKYKSLENGVEDETLSVSVAGRIMVRRVFGKLAFFEIQDQSGNIQLYLEKGRLGDTFASLKSWTDAGESFPFYP